MSHRSGRTAAGALVLALSLAGCAGGASSQDISNGTNGGDAPLATESSTPTADAPGADDIQYVALGDSYAAAPGVPKTDQANGCFRSDSNYAHLLAESADLYLTDVTCSGATNKDVVANQIPALSAETDLVTLGIGGNDFDLFSTILRSCLFVGDAEVTGSPCTDALTDKITDLGPGIRANIGVTLDAVAAAAPAAQVYVVGYPALLPESGTCPDLVPFARGDYPLITAIISGLSDALRSEAKARDLPFVDVAAASVGHDVCSDDPWINGKDLAPDGTIPFHPFAAEQTAVAALIGDML